jgi:hypothetical protein
VQECEGRRRHSENHDFHLDEWVDGSKGNLELHPNEKQFAYVGNPNAVVFAYYAGPSYMLGFRGKF